MGSGWSRFLYPKIKFKYSIYLLWFSVFIRIDNNGNIRLIPNISSIDPKNNKETIKIEPNFKLFPNKPNKVNIFTI